MFVLIASGLKLGNRKFGGIKLIWVLPAKLPETASPVDSGIPK
jgi:hypothetical protein